MVESKDIYITAQLLIKQHGEEAEAVALEKMQVMMEKDDARGAGVWLAVGQAVQDLNAKKQQGKMH